MNNQNTTQISCLENLLTESKAFLKTLKQSNPVGIVMHAFDGNGNANHALLYEYNTYVLVVPQGETQHARIYGDWDEAIHASKRILLDTIDSQSEPKVSIDQYLS